MIFSAYSFLSKVKGLVTGGGTDSLGNPVATSGFLVSSPLPLGALDLRTTYFYDGDTTGDPVTVVIGGSYIGADETSARVVIVEEGIDTIGSITLPVPLDYDEATDILKVRVLASQASVSTDDDVELDSNFYVKTPGSALSADLAPAAPGTVLSTTEQWIEFDLSGNGLVRGDVFTFTLITNGANDTNAEEVLIHAVELLHRSTLVSYNKEDSDGVSLR